MIGRQIMRRLNCLNCLEDDNIEYPFDIFEYPVANYVRPGWIKFKLGDLPEIQDTLPIRIPQVPDELVVACSGIMMKDNILNLFLGKFLTKISNVI